jgi:hypothetical protein
VEFCRDESNSAAYTVTWVAKKFHVHVRTLQKRLSTTARPHGGQNRTLTTSQEQAVCQFIRDQLTRGVPANRAMILRAVADLRPNQPPPSQRWLQRFLKAHPEFHSIRTKSLNTQRKQAQNRTNLETFFQKYSALLDQHKIKPCNLWNVDETGYMIGCYKSTDVIVPKEIKQWTVDNPENRLSATVFEAINAEGYALPECIIIPGKLHMESWYTNLEPNALVIVNDSGYTNDNIAIQYLVHFLNQSQEFLCSEETRLLLIDGHDSHKTERFLTLAEEHNVVVCAFPPHATHLLQPLDVKVFQQCKHFHQKAIDESIRSFEVEYKLRNFLADLPKIRSQALSQQTILSGWRAAGPWPYNPPLVLDKIQEERNVTPEFQFDNSYNLTTPKTSLQTVNGVGFWQRKTEALLSSPSRHAFESFARGTKTVLHRAELYKTELDMFQVRSIIHKQAKARARRTVQSGGQLYAHEARAKREEKEARERAKAQQKAERESQQAAKQLLQMAKRSAIEERKAERKRVADRRARGLRSKVVVLQYRHNKTESESEGVHDIDSDSGSSIEIIRHH